MRGGGGRKGRHSQRTEVGETKFHTSSSSHYQNSSDCLSIHLEPYPHPHYCKALKGFELNWLLEASRPTKNLKTNRIMKIVSAAVASVLVVAQTANGFTSNGGLKTQIRQSVAVSSTPDGLGDYLTKAHEEKLRAVKDVETKKNAEIDVSVFVGHGCVFLIQALFSTILTVVSYVLLFRLLCVSRLLKRK